MKTKKILALGMAVAMTAVSSMTVFAADAPTGATGTYEGYLDKTVVSGEYATTASAVFDFAIDPQGLAAEEKGRLGGEDIEEGATVLFARVDDDKTYKYESRSDAITITSRSSVEANASAQAILSSVAGYELVATAGGLTSDENGAPQLYIAITDGTDTYAITDEAGATYTKKIAGDSTQFEVVYADGKYTYSEITDATFNDTKVYIVAKAAGNWTGVTIPSLTLAYAVSADSAPTFAAGSGVGEITYSAGAGAKALNEIKAVELKFSGTAYDGYHSARTWPAATDVNGVITLAPEFIAVWSAEDSVVATIKYTTADAPDDIKTATVNVKTK